jgi:enoyl-CoA hydratase/carnithine racemase
MKTSDILFEELPGKGGNIGLITLNRPQVLNALNQIMFLALHEQLQEWQHKKDIKAVIIRATEGRAFCAGGDIRAIYDLKKKGNVPLDVFFGDEYRMNRFLHHFSKPYIALLDGITMGGGAGISIHGSHRVGTEKLTFAMPETNIGFYPDVGMTYYLSRLPKKIGYYLGLTGVRITHADCLALGLVQEIVPSDALPKIINALITHEIQNKQDVTTLIQTFAISHLDSDLMQHASEIEVCFAKSTVEEIILALEMQSNDWCQNTVAVIKAKSPTSLKVTLRALQEAQHLNFDACINREYALTCQFVEGHDFFEGIRAVVIDKDQKPEWRPSTLQAVSLNDVANYFTPLTQELV